MILSKLRKQKNYTQKELASKLNVHFQTIQAWESGKTPIPDKRLPKLAEIFGIEMNEIIKLKYDLSDENIQKVAEESATYTKTINEYSHIKKSELESLLATYKKTLNKINESIKEIENNGNDIDSIESLLKFQELKQKVLEFISKIEINL